jgi:hypothetical protein
LGSIKGAAFLGQLNDQWCFKTGLSNPYIQFPIGMKFVSRTKKKELTENFSQGFRRVSGTRRKLHNKGYLI